MEFREECCNYIRNVLKRHGDEIDFGSKTVEVYNKDYDSVEEIRGVVIDTDADDEIFLLNASKELY